MEPIGQERAIHIGINYAGTKSELNGCISDSVNLLELSTKLGIKDITLLVDIDVHDNTILYTKTVKSSRKVLQDNIDNIKLVSPTKENILNEISTAVSDSNICSLFLTYSGHGTQGDESFFNTEESDKRDEYICTLGNSGKYEGSHSSFISDDELFNTINKASENRTTPFVITYVFDCCHSGTIFDLPHTLNKINDKITFGTQPTSNKKNLNPKVTMSGWSGCQDAQYSYENFNNINRMVEGVCTRGFCKAVENLVLNNDNEVNNFDLHIDMANYTFDIDSFDDLKVDISDKYQVVNHSSSLNIGLTDDNKIMIQKFVLGRTNKFPTLKPRDIVTYLLNTNYSGLNIEDPNLAKPEPNPEQSDNLIDEHYEPTKKEKFNCEKCCIIM